jgi:uncharacterized protein
MAGRDGDRGGRGTAGVPGTRDFVLSVLAGVAGMLAVMESDGVALERLSRDQCLRLMGSVPVGRIVYTRRALPAVELVNFALHAGDIVIRTDAGGKLAAATRGAVVAFEADSVDVAGRTGWSVTVVGQAREVTDAAEIARLQQIPLTPWAPGHRDHYIRVTPTIVNGRRLGAPVAAGPQRCALSRSGS